MADNQKIVFDKLVRIQSRLKAPKNQKNTFGGYNYRSCEDILEAVKPIANELDCIVLLSDEVVMVGDRFYIKATATLADSASGQTIENTAYAREPQDKKGMDASQVTGTSSSYARKYALNGLFAIDDTKDADTDEHHKQTEPKKDAPKPVAKPAPDAKPQNNKASEEQVKKIWAQANSIGASKEDVHKSIAIMFHKQSITELTKDEATRLIDRMTKRKDA